MEAPEPPPEHSFLPRHLFAGLAAAVVFTFADAIGAVVWPHGQRLAPPDFLSGVGYLAIFCIPMGLALGGGIAFIAAALRRTAWFGFLSPLYHSPLTWFRPNPGLFAHGGSVLFAVVVSEESIRGIAIAVVATSHNAHIAGTALSVAAVLVVLGAVFVASVVASLLAKVGPKLGRFASFGGLFGLAFLTLAVGVVSMLVRLPTILEVVGLWPIVLAVIAMSVYAVALARLRSLERRRTVPVRRKRTAAAILVVISAALWIVSAVTYGKPSGSRLFVERRSTAGLALLHFYGRFTDQDRDGFPWAFGGQDCNDSDPGVHPGAADIEGDGVDSDCFAGDGSPKVSESTTGLYGSVPPQLKSPNFVVLTADALRPDHLGISGYARRVSPNIDVFAESATRFTTAIAPSSRSIRSIPAMFTGLYPSQILYGSEYLWPALEASNTTAAQMLHRYGYATAAVVGTDYFSRMDGFFQGFDDVFQGHGYKPIRGTTAEIAISKLRNLASAGHPFFLWVHFFETHEGYLHDGTKSKFGTRDIDAYDTEVSLLDREIQRILDVIREIHADGKTVVVLASDHGEAFGEHGFIRHSHSLYAEELRSTLMIRVPGLAGQVLSKPVSLIDLTPTLLNLAQIGMPRATPSRSLVRPLVERTQKTDHRAIFSELMPDGLFPYDQKSVQQDGFKLIWWSREGLYQLYDVAKDPTETNDLARSKSDVAERLLGLLKAFAAENSRSNAPAQLVIQENRLHREPAHMTRKLDFSVPGFFTIVGYDLNASRFRPGDRIVLKLYCRVDSEIARDIKFFVTFKGPEGYPVPPHFHGIHTPVNGRYPTSQWRAGEVVRDTVEMIIPKATPTPANLQILLTLRQGNHVVRLFENDQSHESVRIADIEIQ